MRSSHMQSPSEFLKGLGESLARFDRHRVARIGCSTGVACIAIGVVLGAAGIVSFRPIFPHFIRVLMALVFGGIFAVFIAYALAETLTEKGAVRRIREYISGGAADLATLLEMARTRSGRFPGSDRVIDLLERVTEKGGAAS